MAKIAPEKTRTIAVVGHGHSGKTTLVEQFLFNAGVVPRPGRVEDGTARTDYDAEEITRKISIHSVPATFMWKDTEITAVDCPGYVDFLPETKAVLNAVDCGLIVVSAQQGAEAGTEKVEEYARDLAVPMMCFVTKMDKENANFDKCIETLCDVTGAKFVPYWLPIGQAEKFEGWVDVFHGKAYTVKGDKVEERPVPDSMGEAVAAARDKLVEAAVEIDDALTEKYLAGQEIDDADLRRGMEEGMDAGKFVPVFCGSSLKNVGVRQLLDLLVHYVPTPLEHERLATTADGKKEVKYKPSNTGDALAYCFKVLHEPHVGDVALVRVFNGTLTPGMTVLNPTRNAKEKIGAMYRVVGKERVEVTELDAGEVGALVKLHAIHAGESLASEKNPLVHPPVQWPDPTVSYAVKPATQADGEKLANLISKLGAEDPGFRAFSDPVTHEIIFAAMGDIALDVAVHRLKTRHHISVETHKPKIPYKETIRGKAEAEGKVKKQTGGRGQFAIANLRVEPIPGKGFEFVDAIVGGVVPRNFIPAVEKGLREALPRGVIAGYPLTDLRVTLYFGKYHDVDSSEQAFKTAASIGLRDAVKAAKPVLLEPVMQVLITVPDANMGDIMGDLNTRRGKVTGMDPLGRKTRIKALVPLAEMYRYITNLRSMTGGRGEFVMTLDHYDEVPPQTAQPIIQEWEKHHSHNTEE